MARRRVNTTKLEIIQVAARMFLERGYSNTSASAICKELEISTGNLTFHFPTKEHLLAVMVKMLCDFQWKMMEQAIIEDKTPLMAFCLELTAMAALCEENEIGKDFYISAYTHPMTLDIIRRNDAEKAKKVFGQYCKNWGERNYCEAETLVSGVEYATLMTTENSAALDTRLAGALEAVMLFYNVPEEIRKTKVQKVLAMDYRAFGRRILSEFIEYVEETTEHSFEAFLQKKPKRE